MTITTTSRNTKLLDLPLEIRVLIWEYTLMPPSTHTYHYAGKHCQASVGLFFRHWSSIKYPVDPFSRPFPNKQIYNEARLYTQHNQIVAACDILCLGNFTSLVPKSKIHPTTTFTISLNG